MKNLILLSFLLCGVVFSVSAQSSTTSSKRVRFDVAFEAGFPVGNANDIYKMGLGGSVKAELPIHDFLSATLTAGYTSFRIKDALQSSLGNSREFVPIKAGLKYYFGNSLFAEGEVGASFSTEKGSSAAFAYAPGIGVTFPVSDRTNVDLGVRYESWTRSGTNTDQIGLRLALRF